MTLSRKLWQKLVSGASGAGVMLIALFLIVPVLLIVPMSFSSGRYLEFPPPGWSLRWYQIFWESLDWRGSFRISFEVALLTTALALALGLPAAFAIVRGNPPFKRFFLSLYALPILFPVIILAVSLYYLFAPLHLVGTRIGLALAHTLLALPVVVLPTAASLRKFDQRLEWQALNLGASQAKAILTVTVPLMLPTILTVTLFSFITSFDEVVIALFLTGGDTIKLPKKIWEGLRFDIEPTVAVVATILLLFSTVVMLCLMALERRRTWGK
jgi:ABC-type spermidine/putrescine transport system permease subunit II